MSVKKNFYNDTILTIIVVRICVIKTKIKNTVVLLKNGNMYLNV